MCHRLNIRTAKRSSADTNDSTTEATDVAIPELRIVSWNIESDGNDPAVIAQQLVELGRYDIVALQEVHGRNIDRYGKSRARHLAAQLGLGPRF